MLDNTCACFISRFCYLINFLYKSLIHHSVYMDYFTVIWLQRVSLITIWESLRGRKKRSSLYQIQVWRTHNFTQAMLAFIITELVRVYKLQKQRRLLKFCHNMESSHMNIHRWWVLWGRIHRHGSTLWWSESIYIVGLIMCIYVKIFYYQYYYTCSFHAMSNSCKPISCLGLRHSCRSYIWELKENNRAFESDINMDHRRNHEFGNLIATYLMVGHSKWSEHFE